MLGSWGRQPVAMKMRFAVTETYPVHGGMNRVVDVRLFLAQESVDVFLHVEGLTFGW